MKKGTSAYWWLLVTTDKYQLPLYVAETIQELADHCGVKVDTIYGAMSKSGERSKYQKVKKEGKA